MKKTFISLFAVAAFSLFASCSFDNLEVPADNSSVEQEFTIEASIAETGINPADATKSSAVINGQGVITGILWSPDDAINVFRISDAVSKGKFTNTAKVPSEKASFKGSFDTSTGTGSESVFWAVYPYSEDNAYNNNSLSFSVPAAQASAENSFADGQWPAMAKAKGTDLSFYSVCSGIRFNVSRSDVTSVTFTNKDGMPINGTVKANWDNEGKPQVAGLTGGTDKIVVTPPAGETFFKTGKWYFAVFSPVTMSEGIEVYYQASGAHSKYTNNGKLSFNRNKFKVLDGRDTNYEKDSGKYYEKFTGDIIPDGIYLIVASSSSNKYAFNATNSSDGYRTKVTPANDRIEATTALVDAAVEITSNGGKYFLKSSKGYVYSSSGSISFGSSQNDKYLHSVTIDGSSVSFTNKPSSTSYHFGYSSSNSKFRYSSSSTGSFTLYLLEGSSKASRNLRFAESSVSKLLSDGKFTNTLYGNKIDDVTYTSSTESVATVNDKGEVTILSTGSTTITARADATSEWASGSASYSLTVSQEGAFNLENDKVKDYLDYMAAHPYNVSDYSYTYVTNYYSGTGKNNRLDFPKPVQLSWTGNNASSIYIYSDSKMSTVEKVQKVSGNSANIYNLVPGKTYYWKAITSGNQQVATGQFSTTGRRRMIKVSTTYDTDNANNCRDLGGQVTSSGKKIRYKKIYRGSALDDLSSNEKKLLTDTLNIKLDVDLRGASSSPLGVKISGQSYSNWDNLKNTTRMKSTLGDIFSAVAHDSTAYIHCAVGADRTGYVCLLIEAVLGIPQERCDIDYELTSFSGTAGPRKRSGSAMFYSASGQGVNFINQQTGSTFQEKAYNYIVNTLGIKKDLVTSFQSKMLE